MFKAQFHCMQRMSLGCWPFTFKSRCLADRAVRSVELITQHWMADFCQMYSDLMIATGV